MIPPKHTLSSVAIELGVAHAARGGTGRGLRPSVADLSAHSPPAAPDNVHALDWALAPCKFDHGDLHLRIKALCAMGRPIGLASEATRFKMDKACLDVQEDKGAS